VSFSSPTACRIRSRSRATLPVPTCGSSQPLSAWQRRASSALLRADSRSCALVTGKIGQSASNAASSAGLVKQRTGVLAPIPRGSMPTMSKRASVSGL
jgi:hypothetical protein